MSISKASSRFLLLFVLLMASPFALAKSYGGGGGGGSSGFQFGVLGGVTNTSQDQLNDLQSRANTRAGGISTPSLNSAYEGALQMGYRFSGSIFAILFRPSYFYQVASGGNAGGSYNYSVTGFSAFPIVRLYPLENEFMHFFMQFGLGYGNATTKISELSTTAGQQAEVTASGGSFGTLVGMGTEFCFSSAHCLSLEANYRYLYHNRNVVSDNNGYAFNSNSLSQYGKNQELELDNDDVAIRMGGLQFLFGYAMYF